MSKHQLADSLTKKTLTLEGKIKLLDANKERKQNCRQLVEMFNIGKTASANIIKNEASIRKEYEEFNSFMTEAVILQKPVHWFADWFLYDNGLSLMTLTKYCTSGLKNIVQQISILTD